ncbi:TetR/AcrR family transcriptional regulator [Pseudomonas asuensis]|uniref:TetR family transcriptional regulator n=1 Tax=Pseudomonas asuensis TaxID=1825787 RepID=A0ABQ2GZN7_9PSED|nr:TetR/AcrR family transcriptional regulator [Pseudomonas asuensis]GGM19259.1 TetR family transcriptional regulator [Pseudomonas asuensis]
MAAESLSSDAVKAQSIPRLPRKNNPEETKQEILLAAVAEFAENGLSGARVDAIAERTRTSKRMIYYYFESKDQLYSAVLEKLYGEIRSTESQMHLDELEPVDAIRRLVEFTFDYHDLNVDFVRIVCIENIHQGNYIRQSEAITSVNSSIVETISRILKRGAEEGVFRKGLDPLEVHMMMSSFCFYRVSNRYTFSSIHQIDLTDEGNRERHKELICDVVLRYVCT